MQNIPGIALDKGDEKRAARIAPAIKNDQHAKFAELFEEHADMVKSELALAPVSNDQKMYNAAPDTEPHRDTVNAAGTKAPARDAENTQAREEEQRITREEFNELKDDLKEYGMSDEEIAKLEEKVNSDQGMTWGQMIAAIAQKMAAMRTANLTDEQRDGLKSFFSKFGFSEKESATLLAHMEKGHFSKVMNELKAKLDTLPKGTQILFEKKEIEAFSAALGFSKEFTSKIKEMLGNNALPKDMKEAFTLIRQEMANMDRKDQELTRAVGKIIAKAMGDESKATSAARQLAEAVDLKPRVAEDVIETDVKEELAEAVKTRKDVLSETSARKTTGEALASKVEVKTNTEPDAVSEKQETDKEDGWDNLFGKIREDSGSNGKEQAQIQSQTQADGTAAAILNKVTANQADSAKAKAWENVSAPKVMKQVDNAMLKTLSNGAKQLTLQLTPENLGKLSIVLQVSGKEVGATIRAENADAARIIADNIDMLKNSLEAQGLKVDKLEVQTGLSGNQDYRDWYGENEHNLSREREAMIAMRNHMKQMREHDGTGMAQDLQQLRDQAIHADHGLHIIA